jgi:VIT1/CCC1 family predicted Fe2+/Mn2+ transporter
VPGAVHVYYNRRKFQFGEAGVQARGHKERHFQSSDVVRDIVIGMSDGLTVPFALAAGISGAVASTPLVVAAGLAEIAAGSIAMGLGGYLAGKTDFEHYAAERHREEVETETMPEEEADEVSEVFRAYGLAEEHIVPIVTAMRRDKRRWVDFMMRFELGLEEPRPERARRSALTIALAYVAGGIIPLAPYMIWERISLALSVSAAVTTVALFVFGAVKGKFTGIHPVRGGLQMVVTGGLAASAAFLLARWLGR